MTQGVNELALYLVQAGDLPRTTGLHRLCVRITFSLLALLVGIGVVADGRAKETPESGFYGEIEKSPNDSREYQAFRLDNGLTVLVIHDPGAEKAAASLDVGVGSGSDPADRQGLAHFLEHMLFLGTEKYPDASEYSGFIRDHGGFNNAFTSFEDTNYYFDIEADYLEPALDRFAQFFIAPLFTPELVDREKNAVHSEFSGKKLEDGRRIWSARRHVFNPEHPMSRFSTGSLKTLADRPGKTIRDELIQFYQTHYSANIMTLVVAGVETVDELEAMVREKFSSVENRDSKVQRIQIPLYVPGDLPRRLDVKSLKDQRYLSIGFEIPNVAGFKSTKPDNIVGHLLGHEGQGSLLSALKKRGYAESLSAGGSGSERTNMSFSVGIGLTPSGLANVDEVIEILFGAIDLVRREGVQKWHFDEQKTLTDIGFRFQEKSEPASLVRSLAIGLQEWPPEKVLTGPFMVERYEPAHIRMLLDLLRPERAMVTVVSPEAQTNKVSRFFDAPFASNPIDAALIDRWSKARPLSEIKLPEGNPFLPDNLELVSDANQTSPQRLDEIEKFELWHQTDTSFGVPRANFYVSVRSPLANASVDAWVLTELYIRMVNERLNEFAYPASLAGLGYDLYRHVRGFSVRISGYSDGQTAILARILEVIGAPDLDEQEFARIRDDLIRELANAQKEPPYEQTIAEVNELMRVPYWSNEAQIGAAKFATLDQVRKHGEALITNAFPVAVSHGNVVSQDSLDRAQLVQDALSGDIGASDVEKPDVIRFREGDSIGQELFVEHNDSAVTVYVQGEDAELDTRVRFSLLSQIVSQPFYDDIRTRQQLGYFVFASQYSVMDVPGFLFAVQSPQASPELLLTRIDEFVATFDASLDAISDEQFEQYRAAVMSQLVEPDKRLSSRTGRYWREVDRKEYQFDSRERFIEKLKTVTRDDVITLYRDLFATPKRSRVVTWSRGTVATEMAGATSNVLPPVVGSLKRFKAERDRVPRIGS